MLIYDIFGKASSDELLLTILIIFQNRFRALTKISNRDYYGKDQDKRQKASRETKEGRV